MLAERAHDAHHVGVLEEDQPAVAVVVGERAERLRPQRHLRVELERPSSSSAIVSSVDAAHAVDRDLLDEELLLDEIGGRRPGRRDRRGDALGIGDRAVSCSMAGSVRVIRRSGPCEASLRSHSPAEHP